MNKILQLFKIEVAALWLALCSIGTGADASRRYFVSADGSWESTYVSDHIAINRSLRVNEAGDVEISFSIDVQEYLNDPELASQTGNGTILSLISGVDRLYLNPDWRNELFVRGVLAGAGSLENVVLEKRWFRLNLQQDKDARPEPVEFPQKDMPSVGATDVTAEMVFRRISGGAIDRWYWSPQFRVKLREFDEMEEFVNRVISEQSGR